MKSMPIVLSSALACAAVFAGCRRGGEAAEPAERVQAIAVSFQELPEEIVASGAIDAVTKADVAFQVGGRVESVAVEDGSEVAKDQVLARLDPSDTRQTLAIAEAKLAEVRARHGRLSRLHELGSLTDTDFDRIDAALREAESSAELARRQLAYTVLHAPFEGWVVKRGVAPGLVAGPGVPVFTVLAPSPVWADVSVAEADAGRIRVGLRAEILLPAAGGRPRTGTVDAIMPQADPLSRSFTVRIRLDNADRLLRPGNVVIGHLFTGRSRSALTVPPEAVQAQPDGSLYVWTVDPIRARALRRIVEVGDLRSSSVEIVAGLKPGDEVVCPVPHALFEGTPVEVAPPQ